MWEIKITLDETTTGVGTVYGTWAAGAVINKSADFYVQIKGAVIPVAAP